MPVMDGLQATRLIRSFEETGSWDAAEKAGVEASELSSDALQNGQAYKSSKKRIPIIAVSTFNLIFHINNTITCASFDVSILLMN